MDFVCSPVNEGAPLLLGCNGESQLLQVMDPDLFKAAAMGNTEPFKFKERGLIESSISLTQTRNTILHINIICQNEKKVSTNFVEEILEIFPSLLLQVNVRGDTPLHVAARYGHLAIVRVLIERAKAQHEELESGVGAARQMIRMTNNEKNTALHEALLCNGKKLDVVKLLTKEDPAFLYSVNNCGQTPLYMAAERGSSKMVFELLNNCTSVSHQGPNGKTTLHAAALWDRSSYDYDDDAVKQLLEKMKSLIKETDQYGWTPLHHAAYHNGLCMIKLLLDFDRSTSNIVDEERKMTALHMAAGRGHAKIVEAIISRSPECYEMADNRGWNFLHYAMASFNAKEIKILLKNPLVSSLINDGDSKGNTPLHVLAASRRNQSLAIVSRNSKGNYQAVNKENVSVEHMLKFGCPELQKEILELSKDVGSGQYSKGVISVRQNKLENEDRIEYEKVRSSHLVVAALIATVAFAAAFTVPGGYNSENGTAILRRNTAFQAFVITDTIAMILSLSAVFVHFLMSIHSEKDLEGLQFAATLFTVFSMGAMVIAFVTGTYSMLAPSLGLAITTCLIGLSFFFTVYFVLRKLDQKI